MGRINVYLTSEEDEKLEKLKSVFLVKSKEDVIKKLISGFEIGEEII